MTADLGARKGAKIVDVSENSPSAKIATKWIKGSFL